MYSIMLYVCIASVSVEHCGSSLSEQYRAASFQAK